MLPRGRRALAWDAGRRSRGSAAPAPDVRSRGKCTRRPGGGSVARNEGLARRRVQSPANEGWPGGGTSLSAPAAVTARPPPGGPGRYPWLAGGRPCTRRWWARSAAISWPATAGGSPRSGATVVLIGLAKPAAAPARPWAGCLCQAPRPVGRAARGERLVGTRGPHPAAWPQPSRRRAHPDHQHADRPAPSARTAAGLLRWAVWLSAWAWLLVER